MVQHGTGMDAVAAGQRHMELLNTGASQTQLTMLILNHLHQLLVSQCKTQSNITESANQVDLPLGATAYSFG